MRLAPLLAGLSLATVLHGAALAQPAPKPSPAATPDPALLKVPRETVAKMQGDRTAVLGSMAAPMVGKMQQVGIKEPDRAQVLVQEVVMPTLLAHDDELLDVQARGYVSVPGKDDLQAIAAFYASPAGKHLVAAQPQLAQPQMTGMQGKLTQAIQTMASHRVARAEGAVAIQVTGLRLPSTLIEVPVT